MGKIQIGDSFGCYTVIRKEEPYINSNGKRIEMVTCQCSSCGAINTVTTQKLKRKTSQYCKKCAHIETESLINREFGFLKVIERAPNRLQPNGSAKVVWRCRCVCGKIVDVSAHKLKSGNTKSCGCKRDQLLLEDKKAHMIGRRYNKLVVTEFAYSKNGRRYWKCKCDCGNECIVSSTYFSSPKTIGSCGCEGSKAEYILRTHLVNKGIIYEPQYRFDDCKDIRTLPFDFAIFNSNENLVCLVELHGEQHYYPFTFCGENKEQKQENLQDRQKKDKIKEQFCLSHNIPLLIIKYTDFNNIELIFDSFFKDLQNTNVIPLVKKSNLDFKEVKSIHAQKHTGGVYQIDLTTKSILKKWSSVTDAAKSMNGYTSTISECCSRKLKTAYGYGWAYTDDFDLEQTLNFCLSPRKPGRAKTIEQIDPESNKIIKEWRSLNAAVKELKLTHEVLKRCCENEHEIYRGYLWKFKCEPMPEFNPFEEEYNPTDFAS